LLLPTTASLVMLNLLLVFRRRVLLVLGKRRMHQFPQFSVIVEENLKIRIEKLGILTLLPLVLILVLVLLMPPAKDDPSDFRIVFTPDADSVQTVFVLTDMIKAHTAFQQALTWGRLGEASWLNETYTRPYRFGMTENKVIMNGTDRISPFENSRSFFEMERRLKLVLEHAARGTPSLVLKSDIPQSNNLRLDSQEILFFIIAMLPFCILGMYKFNKSKGGTLISDDDRQVA
jgi:hypothetical protein